MLLVWNIGRYRDVAQEFEPALGRELLASGRVRRPDGDASEIGVGAVSAIPKGSPGDVSPVVASVPPTPTSSRSTTRRSRRG
jgi:hypothetical protein